MTAHVHESVNVSHDPSCCDYITCATCGVTLRATPCEASGERSWVGAARI